LVADDDHTMSMYLCVVLQGAGHQTVAAYDVAQALSAARQSPPPDAILLDIHMPGGTGTGVLQQLKATPDTASIPVLVISGQSDGQKQDRVKLEGANGFLSKPVAPDALIAAVARVSAKA